MSYLRCMDADLEMGSSNITYEDVKAAAMKTGKRAETLDIVDPTVAKDRADHAQEYEQVPERRGELVNPVAIAEVPMIRSTSQVMRVRATTAEAAKAGPMRSPIPTPESSRTIVRYRDR